jgi:hypothetical protein
MPSRTMSASAVEIMPKNTQRKSLVILNEDSADSVYIKREVGESLTVSSTDHDYKLAPGAAITLNTQNDGIQSIQSRYTGVASANTPRIAFFETEDIIR